MPRSQEWTGKRSQNGQDMVLKRFSEFVPRRKTDDIDTGPSPSHTYLIPLNPKDSVHADLPDTYGNHSAQNMHMQSSAPLAYYFAAHNRISTMRSDRRHLVTA